MLRILLTTSIFTYLGFCVFTIRCGNREYSSSNEIPTSNEDSPNKEVGHVEEPIVKYLDKVKSICSGSNKLREDTSFSIVDNIDNGENTSQTIGMCYIYKAKNITYKTEIRFKKDFWSSVEDVNRFQLVVHEIGHCWFGRDDIRENTKDTFDDIIEKRTNVMYYSFQPLGEDEIIRQLKDMCI